MNIKPLAEFKGYFITDTGKVLCNLGKGARENSAPKDLYELRPRIARNGYLRVYMRNSVTNKRMDRYVHRLVAEAFIDNPNNKPCVNHIDCNRQNNNVANLEWVTRGENNAYSMKLGHLLRSEENGQFYSGVK